MKSKENALTKASLNIMLKALMKGRHDAMMKVKRVQNDLAH
jgi:hypothetical protein